jgi:hypothetical protein
MRASFVRHYAGHVENGFDSVCDPQMAKARDRLSVSQFPPPSEISSFVSNAP